MNRRSNKHERLVKAADELVQQQGFGWATLSDIASKSDVSPGNVYYYFKTKHDIGKAIVNTRLTALRSLLDTCNLQPTAKARLAAFLDHPDENTAMLTERGCPIGALCYELSHQPDHIGLHHDAKALMKLLLSWSEIQFRQLDQANARPLALEFVTRLQGMILIANTMEDPEIISRPRSNA